MILNIVTFVSCLLMLLLFRRLDRSNLKIIKLKRFSDKMTKDFRKLAETENRKYGDATIEMDILIKKAHSLNAGLRDSITEIEGKLKGLNIEKANFAKVEADLQVISHAARDVNKQIEFISSSRATFNDMTKKISFLIENLARLERESGTLIQSFNDKVRERSRELSEEIAIQINQIRESVRDKEDNLIGATTEKLESLTQNFSDTILNREQDLVKARDEITALTQNIHSLKSLLGDMEGTVFSDIKAKSAELKKDINQSVDQFHEEKNFLIEKLGEDIEKVYGKLKNVEDNIDQLKSKLISSFEEEVSKIRTELDNLSIHAISKKDDIVKATRKEAETIMAKMEDFGEKFIDMESRLVRTAEEKMEGLSSEYTNIEQRFGGLSEKLSRFEDQFQNSLEGQMGRMKEEFSLMEDRLAGIKSEIVRYEESQNIFSKTDDMVRKVDEAVQKYTNILRDSKEEARNLERFMGDIQKFKDIRKDVEKEIKLFESRRDKMNGFENEIKGLLGFTDMVINKAESLEERLSKIEQVNMRIDTLADTYKSLEERISELNEYEDTISRNLAAVTKTEMLITAVEGKIKAVNKNVERSDKRTEKLTQYLQSFEEKTLSLKSREQDIREVKDKFMELEGLSEHIERKIDQIHAMFTKMESMRSQVDETDDRLKKLFDETDKKMKQFADFLQAVDTNNPIARQLKGDIPLNKNLHEGTIKIVRELSGKGWSSSEISKKLLLDENSVRFIINTKSL